jgi:hypothetical protein
MQERESEENRTHKPVKYQVYTRSKSSLKIFKSSCFQKKRKHNEIEKESQQNPQSNESHKNPAKKKLISSIFQKNRHLLHNRHRHTNFAHE